MREVEVAHEVTENGLRAVDAAPKRIFVLVAESSGLDVTRTRDSLVRYLLVDYRIAEAGLMFDVLVPR